MAIVTLVLTFQEEPLHDTQHRKGIELQVLLSAVGSRVGSGGGLAQRTSFEFAFSLCRITTTSYIDRAGRARKSVSRMSAPAPRNFGNFIGFAGCTLVCTAAGGRIWAAPIS